MSKNPADMTSEELRKALDNGTVGGDAPKPLTTRPVALAASAVAEVKPKKVKAKAAKKAKAVRKTARKASAPRDSKTLEIARYMTTAKGPHMTSALAKKFKVRIVQIRRAAMMIVRLGGKVDTKKSDKATGKPGRRAYVFTVTKAPEVLTKK